MGKGAARGRGLHKVVAVLATLSALVLAACGGAGGTGAGNGNSSGDKGSIEIGYIPWDEDIAVSYLWKQLLEEEGYRVTLTQVEVAPLFAAVANGSIDLFMDVWMPSTHGQYMDRFGDQVEVLGTWYDQADLGLAVPDYVEARSIEDLKQYADRFGKRIVGIEAGAGLMRVTRESAIPGYGLDDWELVQSSTPTMLAELDRAIQNREWIVVTLWRPHWAFAKYDIRYLEDPKGLMNPTGAEEIQTIARQGFSEDFAEVAEWLGRFKLTGEQLAELEAAIQDHGADQPEKGVQAWLEENRDVVEAWLK
ncbi:glycine betaine ABC transporter substrate-binding protein [Thermaerobacter subterraneus]|uniref:ABC-type proline/glycine betaine transport system, periplasmic component n=1 Tax=Thermaerobacter subterraneus DSM 13965 TaxID=867903 RepID=K6QC74_9FIRM|nr:glycine betaine ABC transporter substrate-binding protein [Thermaerobacter subterraneus]EKP94051.1 ABC-type proline/glycine betaine transport system, periplasmic component [Thermaerobacter subterraneus DSM 13965]